VIEIVYGPESSGKNLPSPTLFAGDVKRSGWRPLFDAEMAFD